ncbi:YdcF family protein [Nocardia sp. N2S4-5]|uniref:YdcF family protein n=1 Tax=Nocardia sp. N2S4-5 TaxID=3351565 RepID=UPI0037D027D5
MRGNRLGANRWAAVGMGLAAAIGGAIGAAEFFSGRASRQYLPRGRKPFGGTEAVVVLGYPAKHDGSTHPLQRWRCRIAARSLDARAEGMLVFTGGAVRRDWPEAEVMARYTRDTFGIPAARIVTETKAESTWQNIEFTIPIIEHADRIKIASDPMHAARARRYLLLQRPDLAARLVPAADYRFGEKWWLKLPTTAHELAAIARRRAGALANRSAAAPRRK